MALIQCPDCGKEVSDSARQCPNCGYPLKSISKTISTNRKFISNAVTIALIALLVIFVLKILLRPNIKMDDFDVNNSAFGTLLFLGIPTEIDGSEWKYEDCGIKFYNIPVMSVSYNISDGQYHLFFDGKYEDNLENTIQKYCTYSKFVYLFREYTYKELEVSVSYDRDFCSVFVD